MQTGSVCDLPRSRRPRKSQERINDVRQSYTTEPMTRLCNPKTQLQVPCATIQKSLKQLLSRYPYKIQTPQALTALEKQRQLQFAQNSLYESCGAT